VIEMRTQAQIVGAFLLIIAMLFLWPYLKQSIEQFQPIQHVRVEGKFQYISKEDIEAQIGPLVQVGYFGVDLQLIREAIMRLPWTEKVQVEREWPNRIKLRIYEQRPVIRWQADGLLNRHGDIFKPLNLDKFQVLPVLYAPVDQRHQLLEVMQGLGVTLKDQGWYLAEFNVSERHAWLLRMENGMIIQLGRLQPLEKFTLLMQALTIAGAELVSKMAYIDMRYPNGFTVRWREGVDIEW
jgi:cell division protein FtsQ